jgi:menaquinone-9 beta-reductase
MSDAPSAWQAAARDVAARRWDVAVVGGGPAGAIAALHLARGGRRVVVLERSAYPRDKVCGDGLIPDSLRVLARAGLLAEVEARSRETTSLRVFSASHIEVTIPTRALVIKRVELDELLARAAAASGAVVAQADVERIEPGEPARISIRGLDAPLEAAIVLVATGADVRLLQPLEMVARAAPTVVAIRRYIRSLASIDQLLFWFDRSIAPGYAWLFPLRDGEYNIGCGAVYGRRRIDLGAALDRFLHAFPPLREIANGITHMEPLRGAVLRCGLAGASAFGAPNVLAIGETIGTTFPLTGEGIGKAMETGERAAAVALRALAAGDLALLGAFPADVEALRVKYRGYELGARWLTRPWLNDLLVRLAARSRYAIRSAEGVLNESADPRELFSLRGVWNMLRS